MKRRSLFRCGEVSLEELWRNVIRAAHKWRYNSYSIIQRAFLIVGNVFQSDTEAWCLPSLLLKQHPNNPAVIVTVTTSRTTSTATTVAPSTPGFAFLLPRSPPHRPS